MNKAAKSKKKKKFTRIYSTLKTGVYYLVRIPKSHSKNAKLEMKKYDNKAMKHAIFQSK